MAWRVFLSESDPQIGIHAITTSVLLWPHRADAVEWMRCSNEHVNTSWLGSGATVNIWSHRVHQCRHCTTLLPSPADLASLYRSIGWYVRFVICVTVSVWQWRYVIVTLLNGGPNRKSFTGFGDSGVEFYIYKITFLLLKLWCFFVGRFPFNKCARTHTRTHTRTHALIERDRRTDRQTETNRQTERQRDRDRERQRAVFFVLFVLTQFILPFFVEKKINVSKAPKHDRQCCHCVPSSVYCWRNKQGRHFQRKYQTRHWPTFSALHW